MLLTQAHCTVERLLENFWRFTSLVVLWHLEPIWTITIVTTWTIDTQMAAVVFKILIAFIDIWETPNWNMTCHTDDQYFRCYFTGVYKDYSTSYNFRGLQKKTTLQWLKLKRTLLSKQQQKKVQRRQQQGLSRALCLTEEISPSISARPRVQQKHKKTNL